MNPGSSAVPSAGVGDKGLGCWRWGGGWTHTPSCVQVGQDGVGDDLGDGDVDDGDCLEFYLERESSARRCKVSLSSREILFFYRVDADPAVQGLWSRQDGLAGWSVEQSQVKVSQLKMS